jgi:hypothetical protein
LCAHDAPEAHLVGEVADTAFRGRHYELVVDLGGGRRLSGVVGERRVARGTAVGVVLDVAGCVAFGDPDERAPSEVVDGGSGGTGDAGDAGKERNTAA